MKRFKYTKQNLRKLQLVQLEILKELDRVCRENNINYIIDAGTLLGAVRHGGFIPWDDDVDVRMLRKDYEKFCRICKTKLDEKYFLQTYQTDPGYRWGYAKVLKKGTVFERVNQEAMKCRKEIFIDIFPNDNLPETFLGYKFCTCVSWICRKMLYSEIGREYAKPIWNRIGFWFLDLFPKHWAHRCMKYLSKKYYRISTEKVRCFGWGSAEETLGFRKEWLENTCDIVFEDLIVRAPVKTHEFLVHSFGEDYMTPPPKEQRRPHTLASRIEF